MENVVAMLRTRRIAAVSPPLAVANVPYNVKEILTWAARAEEEGVDVVLFPELSITGYSIADLVRWPDLREAAIEGLLQIAEWTAHHSPLVVVGLPLIVNSQLFNCAAFVGNGTIFGIVPKTFIPNTHEYYEGRWFTSGAKSSSDVVEIRGEQYPFGTDLIFTDSKERDFVIGIELCEDLWAVQPPSGTLALAGATVLLNLSASNELVGKHTYRSALVSMQAASCYAAYAYASSGPTESTSDTVFSGHCMINECGEPLSTSERLSMKGAWAIADIDLERIRSDRNHATSFAHVMDLQPVRRVEFDHQQQEKHALNRPLHRHPFVPASQADRWQRCADILRIQATALAVRMQKIAAKKLVLGVSGGLDSTWALIVCHEACSLLGMDSSAVTAISMPGFGTSQRTKNNAQKLAFDFSSDFREVDIRASVTQHFADIGHSADDHSVVYENAQARERTQVLMDVANKIDGIVVGTADLSELALGWSTYNGDHMSMYSVNSGVPKTLVQHLIDWFAAERAGVDLERTLRDVLATPISPELLPLDKNGNSGQQTEEVLGPYEVHDFFLYHLVRHERTIASTAALAVLAFDGVYSAKQIITWLRVFTDRFFKSQFKRNCQPDGVKIGSVGLSPRADWRMPSEADAFIWQKEVTALMTIFTK